MLHKNDIKLILMAVLGTFKETKIDNLSGMLANRYI